MTPEEQHWRNKLDAWKAEHDARKPLVEAGARYAELAIRSLLLIAGGAAVALAGFAGGSLKGDSNTLVLQALSSSVWWFALAAAGSVGTAGVAYLSQAVMLDAPEPWNDRVGNALRAASCALFLISLGFFIAGAHAASSALKPATKDTPAAKP